MISSEIDFGNGQGGLSIPRVREISRIWSFNKILKIPRSSSRRILASTFKGPGDVIRQILVFTLKNPMGVLCQILIQIFLEGSYGLSLTWTLHYDRHIIACIVLATFPILNNLRVNNSVNIYWVITPEGHTCLKVNSQLYLKME